MTTPINQKIWRWVPGILISCASIFLLSRFVEFGEIGRAFEKFTLQNIGIFILLIIIPLYFRALAWKCLLVDISIKNAFFIINEGYFLNNLIPRSGEVARILLSKSVSGVSGFKAGVSIIFERGLDVIIAAGLFLSTIAFVLNLGWMKPFAILLLCLFCVLIIIMIIAAINSERISEWLKNRKIKNQFIHNSVLPVLIKAISGLSTLANPQILIPGVFWIICSWIFWIGLLFYAIKIISPEAPIWWAIFAEGVLALGIALPSAPASLGVYEGTMVVALSLLGIDQNSALSIAVILHTLQIIITSIIGLIGLTSQGFTLMEIINNIISRLKKKGGETGIE